jgi:ubiquilin
MIFPPPWLILAWLVFLTQMQELMRNQDRALNNIESIPGGFTQLSSLFRSMDQSVAVPDPSTDDANRRMALKFGISPKIASNAPNSEPLPNPWLPPPAARPAGSSDSLSSMNTDIMRQLFSSDSQLSSASPSLQNLMSQVMQGNETQTQNLMSQLMQGNETQNLMSQLMQGNEPSLTNNLMAQLMQGNEGFPQMNDPLMQNLMAQIMNPISQSAPQAPLAPTEDVEVLYHEELSMLRDMGFTNEDLNKRALLAAVKRTNSGR